MKSTPKVWNCFLNFGGNRRVGFGQNSTESSLGHFRLLHSVSKRPQKEIGTHSLQRFETDETFSRFFGWEWRYAYGNDIFRTCSDFLLNKNKLVVDRVHITRQIESERDYKHLEVCGEG